MKVGITTFHIAINYGAVLQAYALQQKLEELETEASIIDYECSHIKKQYKFFKIESTKDILANILKLPFGLKKRKRFKKFRAMNINLSGKCMNFDDLKKLNDKYDLFITGSDQVWNLGCTGNDKTYFLDFVSETKKKNSYAASFGFASLEKNEEKEYLNLLNDFNNIAVREKQGKAIVKKLTNSECQVTLDPTLLIKHEGWKKLLSRTYNEKYILVYLMAESENIKKFANDLSVKTGLKVKFITNSIFKKNNWEYIRNAGPIEFLELFNSAEYVVTNSFHGTAFSINFNKKVFVELLPPPAAVNSRLENIMDMLDIRDREIINGENGNWKKEMNYSEINNILDDNRQASIEYLKGVIGKDYE